MLHQVINIFLLLWVLVPQKGSTILLYVSFGTDTALRLHQPLTASLLLLYPLPSLISNCLNLPVGTQGRSWSLKPILYKQETGDTERLSYLGEPHRNLLGFLNSLFIMEQLDSNCVSGRYKLSSPAQMA